MKNLLQILIDSAKLWYKKDADGMAAVVSYYMLFAVTPLLLVTILITSFVYGKEMVVATFDGWGKVLGPDMLVLLHDAVKNLELLTDGFGVPVVGTLFFSMMVIIMFNTFTTGLHSLWDVQHQGIKGWLKKTKHSIIFIFVFELYLLFLIGFNVVMNALTGILGSIGTATVEVVFFLVTTTLLFSLLYGILPRVTPGLSDRLKGGFVASVLFLISKSLVSWYITTTPIPDLFGAAGLILVLLIWVYVSCSVIYYGAAVAHVLKMKK